MARRTKLTDELQAALVQTFNGGSTIKDACAYVGISETAYYDWMARGRAAKSGRYAEFAEAIKKARSVARVEAVALVRKAAKEGNWQAAAWILERSDPESWARRTYSKIEGLEELLAIAGRKGIDASELFNSMIAELALDDSSAEDSTQGQ
jgi:hypothetical protein